MDSREDLRALVRRLLVAPGARAFFENSLEIDPGSRLWRVLCDVTVGCNLRCRMCFSGERPRREHARRMVWDKLADVVLPHAAEIAFGCRHEPLLHPDFGHRIAELDHERRQLGHRAHLTLLTSASLLSPERIGSGLDHVWLSIPTTDPGAYRALRGVGAWSDLEVRLGEFLRLSRGTPLAVGVQTLILRTTLPHLSTTLRAVAALGIRRVHFSQMVTAPTDVMSEVVLWDGPDGAALRAGMEAVDVAGRELGVEVDHPSLAPAPIAGEIFPLTGDGDVWDEHLLKRDRSVVCAAPWSKLRIDHAGHAYPCPFLDDPSLAWGSILMHSFEAIVNGKPAVTMRRELLAGRAPTAVCASCPYGPG
jgi:MoaA/NifB/PqqE/SkfB family radical SAM enzyme